MYKNLSCISLSMGIGIALILDSCLTLNKMIKLLNDKYNNHVEPWKISLIKELINLKEKFYFTLFEQDEVMMVLNDLCVF